MSKALDSGKSLLDLVLAKLPESLRGDAAKAFAAPEAADALTLLGDSTLARSDYSKQMDEIREKEAAITEDYTKLNAWFDTNKAQLEKANTLEAEIAKLKGEKPPVGDPPPANKGGMTKDELLAFLNERDQSYAGVLALSTTLATKHLRDFNEVLDMTELVQLAQKAKTSLSEAYNQKFAEKIAAKSKAAEDARINQLVDEKLTEERKKFADQPYPLRNQAPSPIDVLSQPNVDKSLYTADAAAAEYQRLVAAKG